MYLVVVVCCVLNDVLFFVFVLIGRYNVSFVWVNVVLILFCIVFVVKVILLVFVVCCSVCCVV